MRKQRLGKIFTFYNSKGGTGKTSSVFNIGFELGLIGKKVLLIDFDPKNNLSKLLGVKKVEKNNCLSAFLSKEKKLSEIIKKKIAKNVDLIFSSPKLIFADRSLCSTDFSDNFYKNSFNEIKLKYDYILIDTEPGFGLLNEFVLSHVNQVIVPLQAEHFAVEALNTNIDYIHQLKNTINSELSLLAIFLTMYDIKTKSAVSIWNKIVSNYGKKCLKNNVERHNKFNESNAQSKPARLHIKNNKSIAMSYFEITKEIIALAEQGED